MQANDLRERTLPAPSGPAPSGPAPSGSAADPPFRPLAAFRPLLIDLAIPLGTYYLLRDGLGQSLWLSLAASSIGPAIRSAAGLLARRGANMLAMLVLAVNLAGLGVSFATGDPRMMIAKDSAVSSVVAIGLLLSVARRRPLMTAAIRPWLTRGAAAREAAWDRLAAGSPRFRRLAARYTLTWAAVLLAECVGRVIGAYVLPVPTMVWLSTVLILAAIGAAMIIGGLSAGPMQHMIDKEAASHAG